MVQSVGGQRLCLEPTVRRTVIPELSESRSALTHPPAQARTQPVDHPELAAVPGAMMTATATKALAVLRVATGFVFLWAFLDKTFGLHYATPAAKAWMHGDHPTQGFLASVEAGPLQSVFHSIAGTWWATRCSCWACSASEWLGSMAWPYAPPRRPAWSSWP